MTENTQTQLEEAARAALDGAADTWARCSDAWEAAQETLEALGEVLDEARAELVAAAEQAGAADVSSMVATMLASFLAGWLQRQAAEGSTDAQ